MKKGEIQMKLKVLCYEEDGLRVAHCLEMDLKGRGETDEEAAVALVEVLEMQISFALQMDKPELLDHPADSKYFDLYDRIHRESIVSKFFPDRTPTSDYSACEIPLPKAPKQGRFEALTA